MLVACLFALSIIALNWDEFISWFEWTKGYGDYVGQRLQHMQYHFPTLFKWLPIAFAKVIAFTMESASWQISSMEARYFFRFCCIAFLVAGGFIFLRYISSINKAENLILFCLSLCVYIGFVLYPISAENYGLYSIIAFVASLRFIIDYFWHKNQKMILGILFSCGLFVIIFTVINLFVNLRPIFSCENSIGLTKVFYAKREMRQKYHHAVSSTYSDINSWPAAQGRILSLYNKILNGDQILGDNYSIVYNPESLQKYLKYSTKSSEMEKQLVEKSIKVNFVKPNFQWALFRSFDENKPLAVGFASEPIKSKIFHFIDGKNILMYIGSEIKLKNSVVGIPAADNFYAIISNSDSNQKSIPFVFGKEWHFIRQKDSIQNNKIPTYEHSSVFKLYTHERETKINNQNDRFVYPVK
jgi:hypothetical protein